MPMTVRCGDTLLFQTLPVIAAGAAVGGKKESEGPLAAEFDELSADNRFGQSSWEAAEKCLQLRAARLCLQKAALPQEKVQLALAGDLQAQCTASSYAMRELGVPFAGLFGACSTMAEGLALGAALCEGGAARNLLAMASSHFCAAERQFRTPLSYGAVRTPTAQWTATAAGCCLLQPQGEGVGIAAATFGRVQDYQVKDINNMGAAMAPAAASTLLHYFKDTGTEPQEFDCIYTGDLGQVGSQLLRELLAAEGLLIKNHVDCGCILFDANEQSVKSGGSGPGCCAAVLCGHILPRLRRGSQKRVLFTATGATTIGGAGALLTGLRMDRTRKLERLLDKIAGDRDNIPLDELFAAAGIDAAKGRTVVESAISHGYFGADAYIDNRTNTLVVRGAAPQPPRKPKPAPAPEPAPADQYTAILQQLRQVNDAIPDPVMTTKISRLEAVSARIFELAKQDPGKKAQLQKFMDYYLPTALKLLNTYASLPAQDVQGENIADAKKNIERSMDLLVTAFENQLDKLFQSDALDVSADVAALEGMLNMDGLTGNEFTK